MCLTAKRVKRASRERKERERKKENHERVTNEALWLVAAAMKSNAVNEMWCIMNMSARAW
jgi:hypothetical protein